MTAWKILKDGLEIARINPRRHENNNLYEILDHLQRYLPTVVGFAPAQKKDHESDFGILLGDGSYLKAELVKEHKFKAGDIIVNSLNKKFQVYKTITDNPLRDIIITKVPDDYLNAAWETHSKDFKLWEEPTLEEWFKAQNFGEEFVLSVSNDFCALRLEQYDSASVCISSIPRWLPFEQQKRIIEKHIELYK